ncbi:hypothetical protein Tco_0285563, partial [Tanacetum coccineum]
MDVAGCGDVVEVMRCSVVWAWWWRRCYDVCDAGRWDDRGSDVGGSEVVAWWQRLCDSHDDGGVVKMDNPNITMEEYIRLEEEKAQKRGKVYNWETAKYGKIWDDEDVHDLRSVETEFPTIVFNDTLTSEASLLCEPMVSSLNNDEI